METILEHVADNLSVEIIPNNKFEFLMTTNEVARGYGVSGGTIRKHKMEHCDELIEGKHFITSVTKRNTGCKSGGYLQNIPTYWTKRGIVRLGFFIKSERAKMFRDWAEDLVINKRLSGATPIMLSPLSYSLLIEFYGCITRILRSVIPDN